MYVRPQSHRYPSGLRLPENYSGSTFREPRDISEELQKEEISAEEPAEEREKIEESKENVEAAALLSVDAQSTPRKPFSLFGKGGGASEELLILTLILLLSDNNKNDDLILFLMLLLFIK